jgi:uncharacterized protein
MRALTSLAAAILALVAVVAVPAPAAAQGPLPEVTGHLVDEAGMLDDGARKALARTLAELERKTATQVVVVTLASLRNLSIADAGAALARQGGVADDGRKAVLVAFGPHDGQIALKVASSALSDSATQMIVANAKVYLRAHNHPAAIARVVEDTAAALVGTALTEVGSVGFAAKHRAPRTAAGYPAMIGWVMDEVDAVDDTTRWVVGGELERYEDKLRALIVVAVVPTPRIALADYAAALAQHWNLGGLYRGRSALLVIAPKAGTATIDVGVGLKDVLTADLTARVLESRVLPHVQVGDTTRATARGAYAITELLSAGPADLMAHEPDHGSWFEANRDRAFLWFIGTLTIVLGLGFLINLATVTGVLPARRKGIWRVLDWIVAIAGSVSVSSSGGSSSSSSRSSSRPFSGGGGSFGGGGSNGSW